MMLSDREYRSSLGRIGGALILQFVLFELFAYRGGDILYLVTGREPSVVAEDILDSFLYLACFILPVVFFRLLSLHHPKQPMRLGVRFGTDALLCLPIGMLITGVFSRINADLLSFLDASDVFIESDISTPGSTVTGFLLTAVVPCVAEELLFRCCVLSELLPYGRTGAIFGSAFLFAVMHCNPFQFLYAFAAGLVLGYLYVASGSVWPCMFLHLFNNFISLLESGLLAGSSPYFGTALYLLTETLLALGGLICFAVLVYRRRGRLYTAAPEAPDRPRGLGRFFAPAVIIYTVLCLLSALRIVWLCLFHE